MAYVYPQQSNNTLLYAILILGVIGVVYYVASSSQTQSQTPSDVVTDAQLQAYLQNIQQVSQGTSTVTALASGTGSQAILMQMFPQTELTGWDAEGKALDPTNPGTTANPNYIYMEDYTFFADETTASGYIVTDSDGSKQIPFATSSGGNKTYYFKSFKINPGTMCMISAYIPGSAVMTGFMLQGIDCRDVSQLLVDYPELTSINKGIDWSAPDGKWTITTLNQEFFQQQMLNKFNTCLDTALGIGNSTGDMSDPNMKLGLHYQDGTQIASSIQGQPQYGRWIYDQNCNPIIDPKTNKQAYSEGGPGWGQSCTQAYQWCGLDPGVLVGVDLTQFNINSSGIPQWVGTADVPGGVATPPQKLQASQIGWMPSTTIPPPANATSLLAAPTPLPAGTAAAAVPTGGLASPFTAKPKGWLNRFSSGSQKSSASGESLTNKSHVPVYSKFMANPTSVRGGVTFS